MQITTVVRTHKRPKQLRTCLESIAACGYPMSDLNLIIISDCEEDYEHTIKSLSEISAKAKYPLHSIRFVPKKESWPPNDYFNQIHHLVPDGYITYIDDDDKVYDPSYYEEIAKAAESNPHMIIWKANLGRLYSKHVDTILPEPKNWGKRPVLSHFSTLNMAVKSDLAKTVKWPKRKGGDGLFAMAFWDKYVGNNKENVVFIDKVLTATQKSLSTHRTKG